MIVLCRHGNTFEAGSQAVWVGARSDLPLTEEGRAQAARVAAHLRQAALSPQSIVAGPLRRTREFAEIVAAVFGTPVEIDEDLRELDYGGWEGLDNQAVAGRFGARTLAAWEQGLAWPDAASGWGESADLVRARVLAALDRLSRRESPVFACTSNGVLRFVWVLARGPVDLLASKVRTGAICRLEGGPNAFSIAQWNYLP